MSLVLTFLITCPLSSYRFYLTYPPLFYFTNLSFTHIYITIYHTWRGLPARVETSLNLMYCFIVGLAYLGIVSPRDSDSFGQFGPSSNIDKSDKC